MRDEVVCHDELHTHTLVDVHKQSPPTPHKQKPTNPQRTHPPTHNQQKRDHTHATFHPRPRPTPACTKGPHLCAMKSAVMMSEMAPRRPDHPVKTTSAHVRPARARQAGRRRGHGRRPWLRARGRRSEAAHIPHLGRNHTRPVRAANAKSRSEQGRAAPLGLLLLAERKSRERKEAHARGPRRRR